ncbi:uncharacterized protein [Drosophila virilis]|uniref:uncharacterized protein isoform X2 n=1 Tax=Drosophila virilis TaxID=7244 RepID=UPI0038B27FEB
MCLCQFKVVKLITISLTVCLAICNTVDLTTALLTLCEATENLKFVLFSSIVLNSLVYFAIFIGINGSLQNNSLKLKQFLAAILIFFFAKIGLSKLIDDINKSDIELVIQIWYQLNVVISGLCFVFAMPFCLKLLEKENSPEIAVQSVITNHKLKG